MLPRWPALHAWDSL